MPRISSTSLFIAVTILCWTPDVIGEVTPFTVWNEESRSELALWAQYWIGFMFFMAATGLIFVKNHVEARWAVGAFVASHLASGGEILVLGQDQFVVGMIAINHCLFWTPAAVYLARSLKKNGLSTPFGVWRVGMLGVFTFSLIFDYRDAIIYVSAGFRE